MLISALSRAVLGLFFHVTVENEVTAQEAPFYQSQNTEHVLTPGNEVGLGLTLSLNS